MRGIRISIVIVVSIFVMSAFSEAHAQRHLERTTLCRSYDGTEFVVQGKCPRDSYFVRYVY